jgi:hypothetical protein
MTHSATAAVARYWKASEGVTFDGSDKQQIYDLLGRADGLISRLDEELRKLAKAMEEANP